MWQKTYILLLMILTLPTAALAATDEMDEEQMAQDSLLRAYHDAVADTTRLRLLDALAFSQTSTDSTTFYAQKQLDLARKLGDWEQESNALRYLAWAAYYNDCHVKAISYLYDAIAVIQTNKSDKALGDCYNALAKSVAMMGNTTLADTYFHTALNIFIAQGNTANAADVYRNIGHSAIDDKMFARATMCIDKALEYDRHNADTLGLVMDYFYYGFRDLRRKDHTSAIFYLKKCLELNANQDDPMAECDAQQYIADAWLTAIADGKYSNLLSARDSCLTAINRAIELAEEMGIHRTASMMQYKMAKFCVQSGDYIHAEELLDECEDDYNSDGNEEHSNDLLEIYTLRSNLYKASGQTNKALEAMDSVAAISRKIYNSNFILQSTQNMTKREFDLKMQTLKQQEREHEMMLEAQSQHLKLINVALVTGFIIVLSLGLLAVWEDRSYLKSNLLLDQKNTLLAVQNQVAKQQTVTLMGQRRQLADKLRQYEAANKRMTHGFRYASMMQQALMPTREVMDDLFGHSLVVLKPLDIVSGDYFWASRMGSLRILVVADCTGHGVPGAFMSMWGISMLNDICSGMARNVKSIEDISPAAILGQMRQHIKHGLRQKGRMDDNQDGMDLAFIVLDESGRHLRYAGANRPLIIVGREGLAMTAADRMPVGVSMRKEKDFTDHDVELRQGDTIYLFSDGMTDQFGYTDDGKQHRLGVNGFKSWLQELASLPMHEQQNAYETLSENWHRAKGPAAEMLPPAGYTDDAILVGIRV